MRQRCVNKNLPEYQRYGGRGITVCERWGKFVNFLADMGVRLDGHEIDRINNDGNYEPENCRWATRLANVRNSSQTKLNTEAVKVIKYALKYMGMSVSRLAELHGVSYHAVSNIKRGRTWKDISV